MRKAKSGYLHPLVVLAILSISVYAHDSLATGEGSGGKGQSGAGFSSGGPDDLFNSTTHTEQDSRRTTVTTPSQTATTTYAGQDSRRTTTTTQNNADTMTYAGQDSRRTTVTTPSQTATTSVTQRLRDSVAKTINIGRELRGTPPSSSNATSTPQTKLLDALKGALDGISPLKPITGLVESIFTTIGKVIASTLGNQASSTQPFMDLAGLREHWATWGPARTSLPNIPIVIGQNASSSNASSSLRHLIMNNTPNTTNSIVFEIKAVSASSTLLHDWQAIDSLTVPAGTQIFLRWSAADYAQCLPFLNDNGRYALTTTNRAMKEGNTETAGYDITESNYTYRIECGGQRNGEYGVDTRTIELTLQ